MQLLRRITRYHQGRDPERLALKFGLMRRDPFAFLRGSCFLFAEDLPVDQLPPSPVTWISGDLHLQNFGVYRGDNGLTYFDINDFDEAARAPALWEITRTLTSIILSGGGKSDLWHWLDTFHDAASPAKPRWIERTLAEGPVRNLLIKVRKRKHAEFIAKRTHRKKGKLLITIDGKKTLPISREDLAFLQSVRPGLVDAARRIAGTGSLGLPRFVLLVEEPHTGRNTLLDLKAARPSAWQKRAARAHPFSSEAERIVKIQTSMQAIAPARLATVDTPRGAWVLKELAPTDDRLDYSGFSSHQQQQALSATAQASAWDLLRGAGRWGAAPPEDIAAFAQSFDWRDPVLDVAAQMAELTRQHWAEFKEAPVDRLLAS